MLLKPSDQLIVLTHLSFADDLVFPLCAPHPRELLRTLLALLRVLQKALHAFGLPINLQPSKSELVLRLTGKLAKPVMQHIKRCSSAGLPINASVIDVE
eukprot:504046-Amphidinium_carterae.1